MNLVRPLSILLFLTACEGGTAVVDDNTKDTGADDTGGENIGGDSADTAGDSGDPAETGDTAEAEPDVAWDLTGDLTDLSFSLVSLNQDDFSMADILVETAATERVELALDPPDDYLEPSDVAGMYLAFFVGAVHEDDGDDRWDPDESWYGSSTLLTVYIDGVVPPEILDLGLHAGWNALVLGGADGVTVGDPMAQPLPVAFTEHLSFAGTHDDTVSDHDRVTTVAGAAFSGTATEALDDSAFTAGAWSLELRGDPPADHFADIDGDGNVEAVELLLAYTDGDHDEAFGWSGADTPLGFACVEGAPLLGWWIEPSPDLTALISISQLGGSVGWNGLLLTADGGSRLATEAERADAVLSADCTLE